MTRLRMVAAVGILALIAGCEDNSESNGNAPNTSTSAGASGVGVGGAGIGGAGKAGGGTTTSNSVQSTGGAVAAAGNTGSVGGSVAKTVGGSAAIGGNTNNAGETSVQPRGGAAGASGSSGTGTCNYPACLYELFSACPAAPASESCTTQDTTTATTRQTNVCYGDGSAVTSITNLTTYASTMTLKRGGTTCYTMEVSVNMSGLAPTSTVTTLKNGSGAAVATETWDVATNTTTVTCTGAQPVVLNAACDASSSGTYNCQPGVCNP